MRPRLIGAPRRFVDRLHLLDRRSEWASALIMLGWAAVLAAPGDSLAGPGYEAFHRFGLTETFWTWAFATVGTMRIIALIINGALQLITPTVRMIGAVLGAVAWIEIAWLVTEGTFLRTSIVSPGMATYTILALLELSNIYCAARDVYVDSP